MRRTFLTGMLIGVVLTLLTTVGTQFISKGKGELAYLRLADDNFELMMSNATKPEDGPLSVQLLRACGISDFQVDLMIPDHAGSSYVPLDNASKKQLNCLVGKARMKGLTLAFVDGFDTSEIACLPGNPTTFKENDELDPAILARCAPYRKATTPATADESK